MAILKNVTVNDTGFLEIPTGTTAQRPATPTTGAYRYNTSFNTYEYYDGSAWVPTQVGTSNAYAVSSAREIKKANPEATSGIYNFVDPLGNNYQAYALLEDEFDGGGWTLAFNMDLTNAAGHLGGIPGYDNTTFWTTQNETNASSTTPWSTNVKTRAYDKIVVSEIMVMVHNRTNYAPANSTNVRGWSVYMNTNYPGRTLYDLLVNATDWQLSYGGRKVWNNYVTNLTWNNNRPQTRGGDMFIDGTVNGYNNASDDIVINATGCFGANNFALARIITTAAKNNTSYGYTAGGFGVKHSNNSYGTYHAYIPVTAYCDGKEIYGNSTNYQLFSSNNLLGCIGGGLGTITCGVAVFVR